MAAHDSVARDARACPALLAVFLTAREPIHLPIGFDEVFLIPPQKIVQHLADLGYLEEPTLALKAEAAFSGLQLKELARGRGLPVSGRKMQVAERIVGADPAGIAGLLAGQKILICSESGRSIAEEYRAQESEARAAAEERVRQKLLALDLAGAAQEVAEFEAGRLFPRGLGIDWRDGPSEGEMVALRAIYSHIPGILRSVRPEAIDPLRHIAAMMMLWGVADPYKRWVPDGLDTGMRLDVGAAARMFVFYGWHVRNTRNYGPEESMFVKSVRVMVCPGSCKPCAKLDGRTFPLAKIPEMPHPQCTSNRGCRCGISAVVELPWE